MRALALALALAAPILGAAAPDGLEACNVLWTTPSKDASGSMPIGNGEVALNVWTEPGGCLCFTVSRTDAWSEASRLLKLGRVRVRIEPDPFAKGQPFRQELKLREGRIELQAGPEGRQVALAVFLDPDRPVIRVTGRSQAPVRVTAALETWRTQRRRLTGEELGSSWTMKEAPAGTEVWESADVIADEGDAAVVYHRDEASVVPLTLRHQGLEAVAGLAPDPMAGRTFGLRMTGPGFPRVDRGTLAKAETRAFELAIVAPAAQTPTAEAWLKAAAEQSRAAPEAATAQASAAAWWGRFWDRSWILLGGKAPAEVAQAYQLQRWMNACQGRGAFPIKFNGGLFTTEPKFVDRSKFDPDYRKWGDCYWFQNTRHMYAPMLMAGDRDCMEAYFGLYDRVRPLAEARSRLWYGVAGAFFPETMTPFGTYSNNDYGWDRRGLAPGDVQCPWWRYAWNQGLELVMTMLDAYAWTGDEAFARERLLPMAESVLRYFDTRFQRDARGILVISPDQAVETYWSGVVNDAPCVAGLRAVTERLAALPAGLASPAQRGLFQRLAQACPPLPMETRQRDGRAALSLAPAQAYDPKRSNIESPELYSVWPFRLFGVGRPGLEAARTAYWTRRDHTENGWGWDGCVAAELGLPDEAARILVGKARNGNGHYRFPAMWGPNYDWLPDQNHGGTLMAILQTMLLQPVGDQLLLLPAWPKDWDVQFKLHAPGKTTVEGSYRNGRIERLVVEPPERAKEVSLAQP